MLVVENTGAELTDEVVASLAEPFVRAAGRISRGEGHGLGLTLVESVVRAHGGQLRLRPRDGGGLVVEMAVPTVPLTRETTAEDDGDAAAGLRV